MVNTIGITVELSGDVTKLTTALKEVNTEIKSTQTQLKDVEKLLKLDPSNTELLTQKQKLLTTAIEDTKTKLENLKTAAEQSNEQLQNGEITQEQGYKDMSPATKAFYELLMKGDIIHFLRYHCADGRTFLFSPEDLETVKGKRWCMRSDGYAISTDDGTRLTQLIMGADKEVFVDHINNDPTDNRRSNLRLAFSQQNNQNIAKKEGVCLKSFDRRT